MAQPHREAFEGTTLGQPVTSENTNFQRFVGEVQSGGTSVAGRYGLGMQSPATPANSVGWFDSGLSDAYGSGTSKRLAFGMYVRPVAFPVGDEHHFAWISQNMVAIVPPVVSVGVTAAGNLVGTGLGTLDFGSAAMTLGQWHRIEVEVAQDGTTDTLLVVAYMWKGASIDVDGQSAAACRRSGILVNSAHLIAGDAWLQFGSHGGWSPSSGSVVFDDVHQDTWPQPPVDNPAYTQPGMNWWDGTRTRKADLLGWWDGTTVPGAELLGIWNGETVEPAPE